MRLHPKLFFAALALIACGPDQVSAEVAGEEEPIPDMPTDLPCGGADLMTDNQNCGECGNECTIRFEGTEWEAGACVDGECGPRWSLCYPLADGLTCDELCSTYGGACVPGGCAGFGSLWIDAYVFGGECRPDVMEPAEALVGCDIGFVYSWDDMVERNGTCCCEGL